QFRVAVLVLAPFGHFGVELGDAVDDRHDNSWTMGVLHNLTDIAGIGKAPLSARGQNMWY
ncbi:MAG TPA: hypothetical protein VL154_11695, partial [Acetobacteraceae bacterium]|nr:hypothetical protein [Acetobacteraceae bacterium]